MLAVRIKVPVFPTEDAEKVKRAVLNLFPEAEITEGEDSISAETCSLEAFKLLLEKQRIRDAARGQLLRGRENDSTVICLNKQTAFVGKINFFQGAVLGGIEVSITSPDLSRIIDEIAPDTTATAKEGD